MAPRFLLIMLGSASFIVTLVLSAWHEGLWERSAEQVAVAQAAPPPVPTPQPAVKAESPRAQAAVPDPAPAPMPVPTVTDDSPAVPPDPAVPEASERQQQERHGEAARGARTR